MSNQMQNAFMNIVCFSPCLLPLVRTHFSQHFPHYRGLERPKREYSTGNSHMLYHLHLICVFFFFAISLPFPQFVISLSYISQQFVQWVFHSVFFVGSSDGRVIWVFRLSIERLRDGRMIWVFLVESIYAMGVSFFSISCISLLQQLNSVVLGWWWWEQCGGYDACWHADGVSFGVFR